MSKIKAAEITDPAQAVVRKNRFRAVPEPIWAPLAIGVPILTVAAASLASGQPLLFASLGPTASLQAVQPQMPTSRFYNVVVGHLVGALAGFAVVLLLGANAEPSVIATHKPQALRLWASVIAVVATMLGQGGLKALHPAGFSTALLITLGGFKPTPKDAMTLALGVLIVAGAGEGMRQLRLLQPGQK